MRKLVIFLLILVVLGVVYFLWKGEKKEATSRVQEVVSTSTTEEATSPHEEYIFVPYWTLDSELSSQDSTLIYFGITGDKDGVDTQDSGYKNLSRFSQYQNTRENLLAVRMLDTDTNLDILRDKAAQERIINDSIRIAKEHNFSGIILDLETQGLPFDTLLKNITSFNNTFSQKAHGADLSFGTLLFGDTFYRVRPYNVEEIAKVVDRIYIMAYDFSKARGNPGPNFPLTAKNEYGYDFETMTQDFLEVVPKNKLTITFGMFGYDWIIDEKGNSSGVAESKTTLQMERMLTRCTADSTCTVGKNNNSGMQVLYQEEDEKHEAWFETNSSIEKKKQYLTEQGLYSTGYWAYSFY